MTPTVGNFFRLQASTDVFLEYLVRLNISGPLYQSLSNSSTIILRYYPWES